MTLLIVASLVILAASFGYVTGKENAEREHARRDADRSVWREVADRAPRSLP